MWDLTKLHTKRLLNMLDESRKFNLGEVCSVDKMTLLYTYDGVKAELAKRPHVPNKIEARKIRQAKAMA